MPAREKPPILPSNGVDAPTYILSIQLSIIMKLLTTLLIFVWAMVRISAQDHILPLWPEGIPCESTLKMEIRDDGRIGRVVSKVHTPELAVYLPAEGTANGTGVVICPGGGYTVLAWDWEGTRMAKWYNRMGIAAFVLKYRLPRWESLACRDEVALMDVNRAIRTVRSKAALYRLDPDRVGVMGFSAGGHLAATALTHFDAGDPAHPIPVERVSSRPDFGVLMYPVITMDTLYAHMGSRANLIGRDPTKERASYYSAEAQVSAQTPPTILIHADNDEGVVPENSVKFYLAMRQHGVPAALHIFKSGGHGFSMAEGMGDVEGWTRVCEEWLADMGLLEKSYRALIIEGQNNHDNWPETSAILRAHLESSNRFHVDIVRTPPEGASMEGFLPDFASYDVVISNYNGAAWPQTTRLALEEFVQNGGGFVAVHAANNAFPDWKAYNEMIGLGGWMGRNEQDGPYVYFNQEGEQVRDSTEGPGGHHGEQHAFLVQTRDRTHPIMAGLPLEWMHYRDELYDRLRGPAHNLQVLATAYSDPATGGSGRHEPMLMITQYGLGRVFHTAMGHLNESMRCVGFMTTFIRGSEWAASGAVSFPVPENFPTAEETRLAEAP